MLPIICYVLLLVVTVEQVFDVISTVLIIKKGRGSEGNGLMAKWQAITGKWWWTIKVPLILAVWAVVQHYGPLPYIVAVLALLASIYAVVLVNNYQIAWRK